MARDLLALLAPISRSGSVLCKGLSSVMHCSRIVIHSETVSVC